MPARREEPPRSARGTAQVTCTSARPPKQIVAEVQRALTTQRVTFKQISAMVVRCQRGSLRFEVDVMQAERNGTYTVRFTRVSGENWQYKDVCARLITEMNL